MEEQLEVLQSAYEYLPKLYDGIESITQYLQEGLEGQAYQLIPVVIEGLQWTIEVITLTQNVIGSPIALDEVKEVFSELIEAMENNDTSLIADIFKYEIREKLEVWYEAIQQAIVIE